MGSTKGGHGVGVNRQGTSSHYWIEDFYHWVEALGLTKSSGRESK